MKLILPKKDNIYTTSEDDPLRFYYIPIVQKVYRDRLKLILRLIGNEKCNSVLDIGYGSGILFLELNKRFERMYGVDVHKNKEQVLEMLTKEGLKAELEEGSIFGLPYSDEKFDCVVCVSVLEHLVNLKEAIYEMLRVLRKDGSIVVGFPVKNKITNMLFKLLGYNSSEIHPSDHQTILNELSKWTKIESILSYPSFCPLDLSLYGGCLCRHK